MMDKLISVVHVKVGKEPVEVEISRSLDDFQRLVGGSIEPSRALAPFNIYCNDAGRLDNLPPNRLGIFGDFVVMRFAQGNAQTLREGDFDKIKQMMDVGKASFYDLRRALFGIPTADKWKASGKEWKPGAHFTGEPSDSQQIALILGLLAKHRDKVVAQYLYQPYESMFSLEVQFSDRESREECLNEYDSKMRVLLPEVDEDED